MIDITKEDQKTIANWVGGGAAAGLGIAIMAALRRQLKRIKEDDSSEDDDDVLYIKKQAGTLNDIGNKLGGAINAIFKPEGGTSDGLALALVGGPLAAMSTYGLVNMLLSEGEKKEAQEELDKAQVAFIKAKGYDLAKRKATKEELEGLAKQANKGTSFHVEDAPMAALKAIPLIAAIASGATAWHLLDSHYPRKTQTVKAPRKIEIIEDENDPRLPIDFGTDEDIEKTAGVKLNIQLEDANDFLIRMVGLSKQASDTKNAIAAIGNGSGAAFRQAVDTVGYFSALNTVKNASEKQLSDSAKHVAIGCLVQDPLLKEGAAVMAAVDFANQNPWMFKAACILPEKTKQQFIKIAALYGKACRLKIAQELQIEKTAAMTSVMSSMYNMSPNDLLKDQAAGMLENSLNFETGGTAESEKESGNAGDSNGTDQNNKKAMPKFIASTKNGIALAKALQEMDALDAILSPNKGKEIKDV